MGQDVLKVLDLNTYWYRSLEDNPKILVGKSYLKLSSSGRRLQEDQSIKVRITHLGLKADQKSLVSKTDLRLSGRGRPFMFINEASCAIHNNKGYFSPRAMSDALGLTWSGQYTKIMNDPMLSSCVQIIETQHSGQTRQTLMLPIDMAPGWLFSIKRAKPEVPP
ncbi:phage antirepressor N-terminal domain-containing protein [Terasakiella pusilla]|uniref:phage antirepressor N-terminal domain-containing protein n=1 Tax=Terasakiella pusilla TaxID=64973 RepID=UPI003AA8AEBC